jgi:hypothetical protein
VAAAKVVTQVSGKVGIHSLNHNHNRNHNHHPKVVGTQEELATLVGRILLHHHRLQEVVLHHLHLLLLLHHRSHEAVNRAPMVQTHQIPVRPRTEVIPPIRKRRFVVYGKS